MTSFLSTNDLKKNNRQKLARRIHGINHASKLESISLKAWNGLQEAQNKIL